MKLVYIVVEHVMVDNTQHNLTMTPCYLSLIKALRAKKELTRCNGNACSVLIVELQED